MLFSQKNQKGLASLPVVLLLGGIIIEIAIAGAFIFYYVNSNVYGTKLSNQAAATARAAVEDAVLRVIRNPNCGGVDPCPANYTITTGGGTATVSICKDICPADASIGIGQTEIIADARASSKKHRIITILNVSTTVPFVTIASITDVPQ